MTGLNSVRQANDDFYRALNEMLKGSLNGMQNIWSHAKDVTLEGPFGDILLGYENIIEEFRREAEMRFSGNIGPIDVLARIGSDLAYVTCTEVGQNMSFDGKPIVISQRATNIFRKEDDEWKLVHHHTDESMVLKKLSEISLAI